MSLDTVLTIAIVLASLAVSLILLVLLQKLWFQYNRNRNAIIQNHLMRRAVFSEDIKIRANANLLLKNLFILTQKVKLYQDSLNEVYSILLKKKVITKLIRELDSKSEYKRKRAITYLSLFHNKVTKKALLTHLKMEQKEHIKILIVNALKFDIDAEVLSGIVNSLIASRRYYQQRVVVILKNHVNQSELSLAQYFSSPLIEIREAFIELAIQIYHPTFEVPLKETLKEVEDHYIYNNSLLLKNIRKPRIDRLYHQTLTALSSYYNYDISVPKYLSHIDNEVVRIATQSMVSSGNLETIQKLIGYSSMTSRDTIFSDAIYDICEYRKTLYLDVYNLFTKTNDQRKRYLLAGVLSRRIEYLLLTIKNDDELSALVSAMVNSRYSVNIINWLNYNKDVEIEKRLIKVIAPLAKDNYDFYLELNQYLEPQIFKKIGHIKTRTHSETAPEVNSDVQKVHWLIIILVCSILIIPVLFFFNNIQLIFHSDFITIAYQYMIQVNIWFIGYYVFINLFYIVMALISIHEFTLQKRLWDIKNDDFLYEEGIIAPISIIVPAYNESLSIEESVRSLLSLKYPNFEVIVVNDGSKDNTLQAMIDAFELKRVDFSEHRLIQTRRVRAIYKNKFYSKLTVVDKENGGKADALNVGINFSKFEYVCGIDADSIIESDGLLKMMSTVLDTDEITLALGGSIVPVNGARVDHGHVEDFKLPKGLIPRFQTIEYLRAFNTGRLSFSNIKSLLIISGAFGLFEKRMLTEIGGYLSASSFKKKTVGEDMELVVRITRKAMESNLNHQIKYTPMARCYTEVPTDTKTLFRQRNRWQRGLIETLSFHRKMIFNPRYGTKGLLGMPYFFIFEMVAPLVEIQIYLSLIIGLITGLFNSVYILLLLVATILLGVILSMISLFVQEKYTESLSIKDTFILILFAVIENFGWRQIVSVYRSWGFFSSIKGNHSWGSMTRVGFNARLEDK
ncbi:MAG: glycosyltransferase family 2 protein [Bacilli bacterium]|nr:glycosyltransferase family 2 protein [Bacilli bacterium]MBN2877157.1 glycosyltransferase family 2 protein [Bacilli bacterium]